MVSEKGVGDVVDMSTRHFISRTNSSTTRSKARTQKRELNACERGWMPTSGCRDKNARCGENIFLYCSCSVFLHNKDTYTICYALIAHVEFEQTQIVTLGVKSYGRSVGHRQARLSSVVLCFFLPGVGHILFFFFFFFCAEGGGLL